MADLTPREQLMLELINRARMDPSGEAARYGITLNKGLPSGTISSAPKQVLAGNDALALSADNHSQWMIDTDVFSHEESGATRTPTQRMALAGYSFTGSWMSGENISFVGTSGALNLTTSIVQQHKNLFLSAGHRTNILEDDFREVGIGQASGNYQGWNASMVTQNFARSGSAVFVTGVVYDDTTTDDNFFTVGEETTGIGVSGSGASDTTGAGGGYELALTSAGSKTLTFDLAGEDLTVEFTLGSSNVKIDAVNGHEIWSNVSLTSLSNAITELHALGVSKMNLTGSSAGEKIYGNKAANRLDGNEGDDSLSGGSGKDTLVGGLGQDTMTGSGSSDIFVFEAADDSPLDFPDTIRDFGDSGSDKIDLSQLVSGKLTYRDEAKITSINQVNVTKSGVDVIVHVNLDADLTDEVRIVLTKTSLNSMTSVDFIL